MKDRIALGLLATIALYALLFQIAQKLLPGVGSASDVPALVQLLALQSAVTSLIAVTAGAFVARRKFLLPAVTLWLATSSVTVYILTCISPGQSNYWAIAQFNALPISASLLTTVIGAKLGEFLCAKLGRGDIAAAT
ncbi:MAG: hypothetical protein ACOH1P_02160 [Lysobacter sp.]